MQLRSSGLEVSDAQAELGDDEGEEAGGYVVEEDAGAVGEAFELADGWVV